MGFLSGVLEAVKNTQTYNVGRKTLQNLVSDEINKHLCSGHDGFTKLLPRLTKGIEKYNIEVRESNEKVKKPIEDLLSKVGDTFTRKVQNILPQENEGEVPEKVQAAEKQVNEMLDSEINFFAKTFNKTFEFRDNKLDKLDVKTAVRYMNSALEPRLTSALKAVNYEIKRLQKLSAMDRQALDETKKQISAALGKLKIDVDCKIEEHVKVFVVKVRQRVESIFADLKDIDKKLRQYVLDVAEWIAKTKEFIEGLRKNEVKKILNEAGGDFTSRKHNIEDERKKLLAWKDKLETYIPQLKEFTEQVDVKIKALAGEFKDISREADKNVKGIFEDMQKKVVSIKSGVLGDREGAGINGYWETLKPQIPELVEKVIGKEDGALGGSTNGLLDEIDDGIGKYSGKFKDEFETAIDKMVTEIVNEKTVGMYLTQYASADASSVKPTIIKQLQDVVKSAVSTATEKLQNATAENIADRFQAFASSIEEVLKHTKVSEAAQQITAEVNKTHTHRRSPYDQNLQRVVSIVLTAVQLAVKGAADSLSKFTTSSNIKKVNEAIPEVRSIKTQFDAAQAGVDMLMGSLKKQITNLDTYLTAATGRTSGGGQNHAHNLDSAIEKVRDTASELAANTIPVKLNDIAQQIEAHLNVLTHEITEAANVLNYKLETLIDTKIGKPKINKSADAETLQSIYDNLDKLQGPVAKAFKEAQQLLTFVQAAESQLPEVLKREMHQDIKKVEDKLMTLAGKQYVSSVKELLTAFAGKVKTELDQMPGKIEDDLNMGFKGFMNKLGIKFVSNVNAITTIQTTSSALPSPLNQASLELKNAFDAFVHALLEQIDFKSDIKKIKPVHDALDNLLSGLVTSQCYDHTFSDNLNAFRHAFEGFNPSKFGEPTTVLTQALKEGLKGLTKELGKAYVNRYSGLTYDETDAAKYAKAFLTLLCIVHEDLDTFSKQCKSNGAWYDKQCCAIENRQSNTFGQFMERCGFDVASSATSKDGELRHPSVSFTGKHIYQKVLEQQFTDAERIKHLQSCESNEHKKRNNFDLLDITQCLFHHAEKYNELCHIPTASSTKVPSSIYDMLIWFCSLPYSAVYPTLLRDTISDLLTDKSKQKPQAHEGLEFTVIDPASQSLAAYPNNIPYSEVVSALEHLCSKSHDVLTCIVGYGDAYTTYGSDYCNNSFGFKYPSSGEDCLQMITDLLRRLLHCLRYLHKQCGVTAKLNGWSDCRFGKNVKSAKWECKDHSTDKPNCQANDKATCQPTCQAKSPLQSYLTDCLYGHLPHQLTSVGCKSTCKSCPGSSPGMPCLTPLGFSAFSGSTRKGTDICEVLDAFFSNDYLSSLFTLAPRPPATLPE
ncbi:hypothetical protein, conserved, partial [Babesia bigemina]